MKAWLRHHAQALRQAFAHVRQAPAGFAMNTLVIAIAFALPLMGLTLLENLRPLTGRVAVEPEISVFLDNRTSRADAIGLQASISQVLTVAQHPGRIEFLPREAALQQMKQQAGLAEAIAILGDNPLPDGYLIRLPSFRSAAAAADIDQIAQRLQALPGVEHVQLDSAWIKRLAALVHLAEIVLALLAGTLAVVIVTVIFNTIRLQVLTQRDEIAVARLVGATGSYVVRPFYYTGALLGICATGVALLAVALILNPLNTALADFAHLYASEFTLHPLDPLASVLVLTLGAVLGFAGAALSVARQLAHADG